ncbi:uncharacterized protein LOC143282518 isoform X2 [Babylonia areolata]|uniref:uncharacterized protein LOC143282518 isoform X2 n=1 Tax=Babylonia areolata TaxID=304850 RepID=UPI003FCF4881
MQEVDTDGLPPARIQCHKGRIRVGDRNYLSASEALAVYLQQFDRERQHVVLGNNNNNTLVGASSLYSGSSAGDVSSSLGVLRPENMAHVSSDHSLSAGEAGFRAARHDDFSPVNGGLVSLKFGEPHHLGSSSQQCLMQRDLNCSLKDVGQSVPGMNGGFQLSSVPLYASHQSATPVSHSLCSGGSSNIYEPQDRWSTRRYEDIANFHIQPNPLPGSGPSDPTRLKDTGHDNGLVDYLDFHCARGPSTPGNHHNRSETGHVFTAKPSQRELKTLAEDALREAKMKRLLKVVKPAPSADTSSDKVTAWYEASLSGGGNKSGQGLCKERTRQGKDTLMEAGQWESSFNPEQPSFLQQEVDEALSRSAELLHDLKSSRHSTRPVLATDVNSNHSADILLSSSTTPTPTTKHPHTPSARGSRSRHRYSYHTQPLRPRSFSLDGTHRRPEFPSNDAPSVSGDNTQSHSLVSSQRFRSAENLKASSYDFEIGPPPPRFVEDLKPPVNNIQLNVSRESPNPAYRADSQQRRLLDNRRMCSPVDSQPERPEDRVKSRFVDDPSERCHVEGLAPLPTGLSATGLQYLKKGTSVLSDCEDLLRELQAVNPPSLPDVFSHKRGSWTTQNTEKTDFSYVNPENTHLTTHSKAEKERVDAWAESSSSGIADKWEGPKRMNGLKSPNFLSCVHTPDLSSDSVTATRLQRAGGTPSVDMPGKDVADTTREDSSIAEFSYMGPGLSFSDLITTPAGSTSRTSPNPQADRPPKSPHRQSRNRSHHGKDSESSTNAGSKNGSSSSGGSRSTCNPVLQDVADILDAIDKDPVHSGTSAPQGASLQNGADATCTAPLMISGRRKSGMSPRSSFQH